MGSSDTPRTPAEGYFPRGASLLNRVMRERAVNLLYGQRALMIGAMQPVAFIGTTQRSKAHSTPWKRLVHTAQMFDAVFFGSREEADKALAFTRRLHTRVNGTIGAQVGPYVPDTPYSAFDPVLMSWVTAPTFDSARVFYETFVRGLSPAERGRLYEEFVTWGELFGMPREAMPPSYREFREWWPALLADEGVFLTEEARTVGLNLALRMPAPTPLRPAMRMAGFLIVGSLPGVVRDAYELSWTRSRQIAYEAAALSSRRGRSFVPSRVRRGSSAEAYQLLRRAERDKLKAGRQSFEPIT